MSVENTTTFNLYKSSDNFILPKRQSKGAAGYDLHSPSAFTIEPNQQIKIDLKFKVELPQDVVICIYMRSGLALKKGLQIIGKVFFSSMEDIVIHIKNNSREVFSAEEGIRIAQMVFHEALAH